ncbi:uncharacterized protein LOC132257425 [Phlebotomus argentipes]|uniref:uncharacterized protein LOC132257425 n=1 Tax=Phlebotomus argentipes TaxID=94469 RepID=UPI00289380A7|nr:uncharacterized protein LOC132257425 [Phlebotomus argentipes]
MNKLHGSTVSQLSYVMDEEEIYVTLCCLIFCDHNQKCVFFYFLLYFLGTAHGTCVLETDFGIIVNCAFKKSGLFRVRNLGGLKAHFGLGLSFGDEIGFDQSLGTLEGNKRRSANARQLPTMVGVLPALKQLPLQSPPPIQLSRPQALTPRPNPSLQDMTRVLNPRKPGRMTEAMSLPLGVPAFKPIPRTEEKPPKKLYQLSENLTAIQDNLIQPDIFNIPTFQSLNSQVDRKFDVSKKSTVLTQAIQDEGLKSTIPTVTRPKVDLMGHTVEELAAVANVSVEAIQAAIRQREFQIALQQQANMEAIRLKTSTTTTTTTTTTTSTTRRPPPAKRHHHGHKVMNAPKEYYPVGYDKNFDDNFTTRVELPQTSFHCGDQKHFPGLYADENLGCMVFHVCALTDDGLIMKSFLCPESTLFDQSILKCNWWFYVDCKISRSLYDSNIPVSKSYQLMKALTFFSTNYKNSPSVDIEALKNSVAPAT